MIRELNHRDAIRISDKWDGENDPGASSGLTKRVVAGLIGEHYVTHVSYD